MEVKARSLACHATQMNPNSPFARIPPDLQREMRRTEVFALRGRASPSPTATPATTSSPDCKVG